MTSDSKTISTSRAKRRPLLAWLGVMSLLLATWVYRNHEPRAWVPIGLLAVGGLVSLLASLVSLSRDRSGLVRLLVAAAHLVSGMILLSQWRLIAAGEWISALVFGVACLAMGMRSVFRTNVPSGSPTALEANLDSIRSRWKIAAFVLAGVCIAGTAMLLYSQRSTSAVAVPRNAQFDDAEDKAKGPAVIWDWKFAPETAGAVMLAVLFLAAGVRLSGDMPMTLPQWHMLQLTVGGGIGLIAVLMLLLRAIVWRNELFAVGPDLAGAWRFWLWSYALLGALGLMFVSFQAAQGEIREQEGLRRLLFGYDLVFRGLLVFALLFLLNVLIHHALPFNYNWSKARGLQALSPASVNLLASLKKPAHVYALLPKNYAAYGEVLHLLENAAGTNRSFEYEVVDPDVDKATYEVLQSRFKVLQPSEDLRAAGGRGLLVTYGEMPADPNLTPPHAFVAERKLYDQRQEEGKTYQVFKGESELMKELNGLVQSKEKRKIYMLQGHDELDVRATELFARRDTRQPMQPLGAANLMDQLQKDNYEVKGLSLARDFVGDKEDRIVAGTPGADQKREVPKDASVLIIPGPSSPFPKDTLEALQRYMDRGGRMLIHFEIVPDASFAELRKTGLEDFVRRYNVDVTDDFILNAEPKTLADLTYTDLFTPSNSDLRLARQFADRPIPMRSVRVIRPQTLPGPYKAQTLLEARVRPSRPWPEGTVAALRSPITFVRELIANDQILLRLSPKAVPGAVVVTEGKDEAATPRLAVFGDAEMVSNAMLARDRQETLIDLEIATIAWLADTGGYVGPRPIETGFYKAKADTPYTLMLGGPLWAMTLGVFSLGLCLWVVRRR